MASHSETEKKPIYKKWWFWLIIVIVIIAIASTQGGGTNTTQQVSSDKNETVEQTLNIGETWTVDGQWNLTINSVETTTERNQFSDKNPQQVVYVTYTYENTGYEDRTGIMEGLYFALEPSGDANVIDGNGEIAYSYPNNITTYPQQTPVGAKCVNAQSCIGLNNVSDSITMNISKYDGNGQQHKVKYTLNIN